MLVPLEGIDDAKPDGGFNGSVISFFFSPFICFFDLSFPFQLAGNPDGDAKLAACDRFFLESIEFLCCSSLIYLLIFFLLVFNRVFRTNPNRNFRVPEMLGINFSKQISISIF